MSTAEFLTLATLVFLGSWAVFGALVLRTGGMS